MNQERDNTTAWLDAAHQAVRTMRDAEAELRSIAKQLHYASGDSPAVCDLMAVVCDMRDAAHDLEKSIGPKLSADMKASWDASFNQMQAALAAIELCEGRP